MTEAPRYYPPAAMGADDAAAYVGLGTSTFRREVVAGNAPRPVHPVPGRAVWRRADLDAWLDRLAGDVAASAAANPWDR